MSLKTPARNAPCPCGSGKKYKICCMEKDRKERSAKNKSLVLLAGGAAALLLVAALAGSAFFISRQPGPYDALAQCITKKGFVMYGASWCSHCSDQKSLFGKSFKYINYVECAMADGKGVKQMCKDKGIEQLPSWVTPDGAIETGVKQPSELSLESSCPLDNKTP